MKTKLNILAAIVVSLTASVLRAQVGTATLNATGNWSDSTKWTSTPSGFAPNNGNNGQNWNATVNANTVTVNADVIIQALTFTGGTIQGTSTLTVNGASSWSNSTFAGAGVTSFAAGSSLAWSNSGSSTIDARTINNSGNATWTGSGIHSIRLQNAAVFNNEGLGTVTFNQTGNQLFFDTTTTGGTVNNAGTMNKDGAGTVGTQNLVVFNNSGTLNVNAGVFSVSGGGTGSGTFDIDSGAQFRVAAGTYTMTGTVQVNGQGEFLTTGGTASFVSTSTGSTGNLGATSGTLLFNAGADFTTSGGLRLSGGSLSGPGAATFGGTSLWTGGIIQGSGTLTFASGSTLSLSNAGTSTIDTRKVDNQGTVTWTSGNVNTINIQNGASFNNLAGGVFTANHTGNTLTFGAAGTGGVFNNEGTFNKDGAGTVTTSNLVAFHNDGLVNVNGGLLTTNGGGTAAGVFDIDNGTEFRVAAGSYTMEAGVKVNGLGVFKTTGGTTTFNDTSTGSTGNLGVTGGAMNFATGASFTTSGGLRMSGGTLGGSGSVTFGGTSDWSGGTIQGSGSLTFSSGGTLTLSNGGSSTIDGRTVNNQGTATWGGSGIYSVNIQNGGSLNNQGSGTLTVNQTGNTVTFQATGAAGSINNSATFNKTGAGTASVAALVTFNNTGAVNVTGGVLTLNTITQHSGSTLTAGSWNVTSGATLNFNSGSNITTIGTSASVSLDGVGASFAKINALTTNQGGFSLKNDRDFTTASAFSNSGTVSVQHSSTVLTVGSGGSATYTQTGTTSVTILAGGAMIDTSAFNLNGGQLKGTGIIDGPLSATTANATMIAPGASPGTITINGSTVLGANNTLAMEVGGLAAGIDYDLLVVNGVLTLGGLLDVDFINGFQNSVAYNDVFTIATSSSAILGAFSNVASGGLLQTNFPTKFEVWYGAGSPYGANNLVLTHSPEPSRALLIAMAAGAVVLRRRRKV